MYAEGERLAPSSLIIFDPKRIALAVLRDVGERLFFCLEGENT
jgi:hypothetical protein